MYKRVLEDDKVPEQDAGEVCKLIEVVLQNCRARVDAYLPPIVVLAVNRLLVAKSSPFKVLLLEVIANALYYNAGLTLQIIEQTNSTQAVFTLWLRMLFKSFKRVHDKKITILGLSSIFDVNWQSLPTVVKAGFKQILQALVKLLNMIAEQKEKEIQQAEAEDEDDEDDEDEEDDNQEEVDDNEDVNEDIDLQQLAEEASEYSPMKAGSDASNNHDDQQGHGDEDNEEDDDDDDDDLDSDLVEVVEISSPIDDIHELVFFVERFTGVSLREKATYDYLLSLLSAEEQQSLHNLFQQAKAVEHLKNTTDVPRAQS